MKTTYGIVFIMLLNCYPLFAMQIVTPDDEIKALLLEKLPENHYIEILKSRESFRFSGVHTAYFKNVRIYECQYSNIGLARQNFVVAISGVTESVHILTQDIDALNKIYKICDIQIRNELDAKFVAREAFDLTRPFHEKFILLQSEDYLKRWIMPECIKNYKSKVQKFIMKKGNNAYIGNALIVIGRDVIERTVKVDENGFSFNDRILGFKEAIYFDPHESP